MTRFCYCFPYFLYLKVHEALFRLFLSHRGVKKKDVHLNLDFTLLEQVISVLLADFCFLFSCYLKFCP